MKATDLMAEHTAPVRELVQRLRELVRKAMPEAEERVYRGWHGLGYVHPAAGYVCGVFPGADGAKLGFEHGHELPDPSGLLTGGGTRVRYVELAAGDPIPRTAIGEFIDHAIALRS